jgi:hypothetical protein
MAPRTTRCSCDAPHRKQVRAPQRPNQPCWNGAGRERQWKVPAPRVDEAHIRRKGL